ncbi:uncharacterized protein LOC144141586 isoform X1 [Haemaphysalis longicornis]
MAGGNTDAPDRPFIKIIVKRRYRLTCELTSVGAANLIRCIHCNDIAEAVFSLKCKHNLCGECFFRCIPYTCVKDGISTEKGLHRRPILRVNEGLAMTVVQCPECCDNFVYEEFKRHMDNSHSGFRGVIGVRPYQEKQKKCGEVPEIPTEPASRGNEPLGDGTDRGCPNCPQCQDLWDKKDLQEHVENCRRNHSEALNLSNGKTSRRSQPADALFSQRQLDSTSVKVVNCHFGRCKRCSCFRLSTVAAGAYRASEQAKQEYRLK